MILILLFTFIVISLSVLSSAKILKNGLELSYIVMFLFIALRYDFGNDYMRYLEYFIEVNKDYEVSTIFSLTNYREPGWVVLYLVFGRLGNFGFYLMVALLSFASCYILYKFTKKYVPIRYHWLSVTSYILNPYFFWIPLSMMRQWFSVVLLFYAFNFIEKKKLLFSLLMVLIAVSIHQSAYILFPLVFIGFIPFSMKRHVAFILFLTYLFLSFLSLESFYNFIGNYLIGNDVVYNYMYFYGGGDSVNKLGIGAIVGLFPFIVLLYSLWSSRLDKRYYYLVLFAGIGYLISPLAMKNQWIGRLGYYFNIFNIFTVPITYICLKDVFMRNILIGILILFNLYQYMVFFGDPNWSSFTVYSTIISTIL